MFLEIYSSSSFRLMIRFPCPTWSTNGHLGSLVSFLSLPIPMLLYSAASSNERQTFSQGGIWILSMCIYRFLSILTHRQGLKNVIPSPNKEKCKRSAGSQVPQVAPNQRKDATFGAKQRKTAPDVAPCKNVT